MDEPTLNPVNIQLRDIHLAETISWWPPAPGWWLLLASILLLMLMVFIANIIARKTYFNRQLKRDIKAELEQLKQQFQHTQNKSILAKSLSALLRRASISYYPEKDVAGLTGNDWLNWLDAANTKKTKKKFQSDIGRILLTAPYSSDKNLTENNSTDNEVQELIDLCESWLRSAHTKKTGSAAA